jgi:hypothetical protein
MGHIKIPVASSSVKFNEYTGIFLFDAIHGSGKLKYYDGRVYEGEFVRGAPYGKGRLSKPDPRNPDTLVIEYEGYFENGMPIEDS